MYKYAIDGRIYTIKDLSEKSGVTEANIRYRLAQGYTIEEAVKEKPIHESVKEFGNNSYWRDWLGVTVNDVYEIYWKWCLVHDFTPLNKINFGRQIQQLYPIKTVANRRGRVIRVA